MVAAAADGQVVIGQLSWIEDADEGACRILGYERDELIGRHGADLVCRVDQPSVAASIDRMRRGDIQHRQGRLVRKDGTIVEVEVSANALADGRLALVLRERNDGGPPSA